MAIALRASASVTLNTTGDTTITVSKPSTVAVGDMMVAFVAIRGDVAISGAPTGWTLLQTTDSLNSNAGVRNSLYVRRATSTEGASYTWTQDAGYAYAGWIGAYSGVSTSTAAVIASAETHSTDQTDTTVTCPALDNGTTSTGVALIVGYAVNPLSASTVNVTFTPPSGLSEAFDSNMEADASETLRASLGVAHLLTGLTTGTSTARTATVSNGGSNVGLSLMLLAATTVAASTTGRWLREFNYRPIASTVAGSLGPRRTW